MYGNLFTVDEPSDSTWEEQLNPESEIVLSGKVMNMISSETKFSILKIQVDSSISKWPTAPEASFQFERVGFFVVDKDSTPAKLVFNLTVALKEGGKPKLVTDGNSAVKSRKEEQAKQMAEKMVRFGLLVESLVQYKFTGTQKCGPRRDVQVFHRVILSIWRKWHSHSRCGWWKGALVNHLMLWN